MDFSNHTLTPSLHDATTLSIAEDVGEYCVVAEPEAAPSSDLHAHGDALRIAMALVTGATEAGEDRLKKADELRARMAFAGGASSPPETDADLAARLQRLSRTGDRAIAEQLRLLPRFDDAQLWKADGCRDCIVWMDRHLGLHLNRAHERLRIARELQSLPVIESVFTLGKLSYSPVRELTCVADASGLST